MRITRWLAIAAAAAALLPGVTRTLEGQGLTTGAISGTVSKTGDIPLERAQIEITNIATGFKAGVITRSNGFYFAQGLEVGEYRVAVRMLGYAPQVKEGIRVTLNSTTRVDFELSETAVQLAAVTTTAAASGADFSPTRQGVATVVTDTLLRRVPSLQRDFTEMVKLTPQVNARDGGASAGGAYNRLNNYTVDGANQNDRFNLGSSGGVPGGATGGRIMSVDAVKEFQVLMSPTDVRYGNFGGMLVNAVTRGGTNTWTGGATYTYRNPRMAADVDQIRQSGFQYKNYGFYLGGPIIKDKLHFFVAPEFQDRTDPTTGPGENPATGMIGNVSLDSIAVIRSALASRFDIGSTGAFSRGNPLTNLFARLDWSVNERNRATLRILDNKAEQDEFFRNSSSLNSNGAGNQSAGIRLTSNRYTRQNTNRSIVGQFFTNFNSGAANELLIGYNTIRDKRIVPVEAPEISLSVQGTAVTMGTERFSPGNDLKQSVFEVSDNVSVPLGAHNLTFGGRFERTSIYNFFLSGAAYGAYQFQNIAALQAGTPSSYAFSYANGGDIAAEFQTQQISLYAQDLWNVTRNLSVTAGVRLDRPDILEAPKQNAAITAKAANIRTDWKPETRFLFSPRVGFNWDVDGKQTTQIRGNVGIYTAQAPFIFIGNAYANTGLGGVTVTCRDDETPEFVTDINAMPKSCAGLPAPTPGAAGSAGINVTDPNFKYPQNLTLSAGFDRKLPWGVVATFEGVYRKDVNGLYVRDLNFKGPAMLGGSIRHDRNGRVMYADSITTSGSVRNNNQKYITSYGTPAVNFTEGAIMLTNSKSGYNYTLSGQLKKRFTSNFEATAAYNYTQSKDVQSLTSDRSISSWRNGRQYAGLENDPYDATTSNFQRPHRFILYGTYTAPWKASQTDITFFFEGISGAPYLYVANADLNGDGFAGNDPIYVPKNALDPNEIRIGTGSNAGNYALSAADAQIVEDFIKAQPCLDKQRGHIMKRNSCQGPFQQRMDVSVRQTIPQLAGQRFTVQLDVFNFANLLNRNWGQLRYPVQSTFNNQQLFNQAGRTAGTVEQGMPNFVLNSTVKSNMVSNKSPFRQNPNSPANNYQLQLTLRYSF